MPQVADTITQQNGLTFPVVLGMATPSTVTLASLRGYSAGNLVYVESQKRSYVAVPIGDGDITGEGVDWKSDSSTSSPAWLTQPTWFIDGTSGDDDASGVDAEHPIKTGLELYYRLGGRKWVWTQSVTITILGNIDLLWLDFEFASDANRLYVTGPLTTLVETTVATWSTFTGNTSARLTATDIADWTPYLNYRVRIVGGPRDNTTAFVAEVSPDGVGVATAAFCQAFHAIRGYVEGAQHHPTPGDIIRIESLRTINKLRLKLSTTNTEMILDSPLVNFTGLNINDSDITTSVNYPYTITFWGCRNGVVRTIHPASEQQTPTYLQGGLLITRYIANIATTGMCIKPVAGASTIGVPANAKWFAGHDLVQGAGIVVYNHARVDFAFGSVGIQNATFNAGLAITAEGVVLIASNLYGKTSSANVAGVTIQPHAKLIRSTAVPTLTGPLGDLRVGMSSSYVYLSWASIGGIWADGRQKGTGTLGAGGTVTITVPYWNPALQTLLLAYNDRANNAVPLDAPIASRTNTQFVVRGAVDDTTSTFSWEITPIGHNQFVERYL